MKEKLPTLALASAAVIGLLPLSGLGQDFGGTQQSPGIAGQGPLPTPVVTPTETPTPSPTPSPSPSALPTGTSSPVSHGTISTSSSPLGTFLVDGDGRSLYLFAGDAPNVSNCNGDCAATWPPYLVVPNEEPSGEGDADGQGIAATVRSDGSSQATYYGHPLYYYAGDTVPGQTNGQGLNQFGATWYLVQPDGSSLAP